MCAAFMVNNVNTTITPVVAGPWFHDCLLPPAIPAPVPTLAFDLPCTQKWAMFFVSGKFTTTVVQGSGGNYICLDGHNVGPMILHVTIPMSPMLAIIIPLSERKIMFSAAMVQMDGKSVGCAGCPVIPLPMMDCGDPAGNPLLVFPINFFNNTLVGMSLVDFLMGLASIALDLLIDVLFFSLGGGFKNMKNPLSAVTGSARKFLKSFTKETMEIVIAEGVKKILPIGKRALKKWALKQGAGSAMEFSKTGKLNLVIKIGHGHVNETTYKIGEDGISKEETVLGQTVSKSSYNPFTPSKAETSGGSTSPVGNSPPVAGNSKPENLTS